MKVWNEVDSPDLEHFRLHIVDTKRAWLYWLKIISFSMKQSFYRWQLDSTELEFFILVSKSMSLTFYGESWKIYKFSQCPDINSLNNSTRFFRLRLDLEFFRRRLGQDSEVSESLLVHSTRYSRPKSRYRRRRRRREKLRSRKRNSDHVN